jgi:hypothetical protein
MKNCRRTKGTGKIDLHQAEGGYMLNVGKKDVLILTQQ